MSAHPAESMGIVSARRLVGSTTGAMLFETARSGLPEAGRSLLFQEPLAWLEVAEMTELPRLFTQIEEARRNGLWVAGFLSYECGYLWEPTAVPDYVTKATGVSLAAFGVYAQPSVCSDDGAGRMPSFGVTNARFCLGEQAFTERFERVQEWIAAGDTYQVNLTFALESVYRGGAAGLFAHMMGAQPVPFGAMLNLGGRTILSASPELFFHQRGRSIETRPMKGTSRRGTDAEQDDRFAAELASDEKNRAENVMIVDLLRNDLGRIAEIGSVRASELFRVERHPSLLQMTSRVDATLRENVGAYELFASLFPSGSIVGAPKVRTMQLIRELEGEDRGPYTGAIGFFSPQQEAVFSVAIRTAVLAGERLTMGVGAGITSGSVASEEYEECMLKAQFLREPEFSLVESVRCQDGHCELLQPHLDRIEESAGFFGFSFDRARVETAFLEEASRCPQPGAYKLRLELNAEGVCSFSPVERLEEDAQPPRAVIWPVPVDATDMWLRHKTTRRKVYDDALRHAREAGFIDAIFVNEAGEVTEGTIYSVFVRHGERWRTAPVEAGALPGVSRRLLLSQMPQIEVVAYTLEDLMSADEVLLTNAVRGMRRLCSNGVSLRFAR